MTRQQPKSTLFPYTTLFRSQVTSALAAAQNKRGPILLHFLEKPFTTGVNLLSNRQTSLGYGAALLKVLDRKSTRLNSSHRCISYAVFCLKKKNKVHQSDY